MRHLAAARASREGSPQHGLHEMPDEKPRQALAYMMASCGCPLTVKLCRKISHRLASLRAHAEDGDEIEHAQRESKCMRCMSIMMRKTVIMYKIPT